MRRVATLVSILAACSVAGAAAAVALGDDGSGTTVSTPTVTTPTTTETGTTTTLPTLPSGVVVGGISVGGLATTDAASAIRQAFATPVELTYRGTTISIAPDLLGATAAIDRALAKAQTAPPDAVVQLQVRVDRARIAAFLGNVAKRFDRSSVDARLLLRDLHPVITPARRGVTVDIRRATAAIATALTSNRRSPIPLPVKYLRPKVAPASFPSIIVIRRGSNALYLYRQTRLQRMFRVATGQSVYPTPLGRFQIG